MDIRRIVTGHDAAGKAVVIADEVIAGRTAKLFEGFKSFELWQTEAERNVPHQGPLHEIRTYFPARHEVNCRVVEFPPDRAPDPSVLTPANLAEMEAIAPGLMAHMEPDNPGMHTTDTIDFGIVLEGELELELDNGGLTKVVPGCIIVQNGTRHAWRNRSGKPAKVAFILLGAERR
jgi:hypothetical protein